MSKSCPDSHLDSPVNDPERHPRSHDFDQGNLQSGFLDGLRQEPSGAFWRLSHTGQERASHWLLCPSQEAPPLPVHAVPSAAADDLELKGELGFMAFPSWGFSPPLPLTLFPTVSMRWAALRTRSRACSSSRRDSARSALMVPCSASGFPKATRVVTCQPRHQEERVAPNRRPHKASYPLPKTHGIRASKELKETAGPRDAKLPL